jgi:two-component system chemotaxis sensor kinase CheA
LGFKRLEKLAHAGENLLGLLREGKLTADGPIITGLLELLDGLRSILKSIEAQDSRRRRRRRALIGRLEELQAPGAGSRRAPPRSPWRARAWPACRRGKPRSRAKHPERKSPRSGSIPTPPPRMQFAEPALPHLPHGAGKSRPAEAVAGSRKERAQPAGSAAAESTLRVDVTLLNRMMNLVGELVLTRNQVLQATAADPNLTLLSRRLDMVTPTCARA